jgi:hypothetical protein
MAMDIFGSDFIVTTRILRDFPAEYRRDGKLQGNRVKADYPGMFILPQAPGAGIRHHLGI